MTLSPEAREAVAVWPERLTLRDTKVIADEGQRIFTTATGYGYEKREYVRADIASPEAREEWCQRNGITKQAEYDINQAIGGTYELPDGRSFWLDHVVVKEIMRRAIPYIAAECERHRLVGGREAHPAKQGGC